MTPRITVITPTKNRWPLLLEAMESICAQGLSAWEHIVVDDGSTDETADEVERRAATDLRVRYLKRTGVKCGANVCRNQGLLAARSDLVVFLDSDDLLEPDCLERRVRIMDRNADLDFSASRTGVFINKPGDLGRELDPDIIGDDLLRFLYFETPWQTTATTWRRSAIERLGAWDESLPSWQDVDLHIRAIAGGMRYLRLPVVDHHMRWQEHPDKISTQQRRSPAHLQSAGPMLIKFENAVREGPGMTWARQRAICNLYFFIAERWMELGESAKAIEAWGQVRRRSLGSRYLYRSGVVLLRLQTPGGFLRRPADFLCHKWKGWMRLRSNPELVLENRRGSD